MEQNPYESPKTGPSQEPPRDEPPRDGPPKVVRSAVPVIVGIVWNVPLAAVMVALFRGAIDERTMERLMAAWALSVPLVCVALIYWPWLQRLVFVPGVDMPSQRRKLWSLAVLWLVILAIWVVADLARYR